MKLIDYKKFKQIINATEPKDSIIFYSSALFKLLKTDANKIKFNYFDDKTTDNSISAADNIYLINLLKTTISENDAESKNKLIWIIDQLKILNLKHHSIDYKDNLIQSLIDQCIGIFKKYFLDIKIIFYFTNIIQLDLISCFILRKMLDNPDGLKFAVIFDYSYNNTLIKSSSHLFEEYCYRLNLILDICIMLKLWDKTITIIELLLKFVKQIKNEHLLGLIYFKAGMIYVRNGFFKKARQYYNLSENLFKKTEDKENHIKSLNNLGNIYISLEKFELARDYFKKALSIAEENQDDYSLGVTYGSMGNVQLKLGNIDEAIDYLKKSILFNFRSGFFHNIHYVYGFLGDAYNLKKCGDKAKEHYLTALYFSELLESKIDAGNNKMRLADFYINLNNYEVAMVYYRAAEKNYNSLRYKYGLMFLYEKIGDLYLLKQNKQTAIKNFQKSEYIAETMSNIVFLKKIRKKIINNKVK